jgi:hypothetical protein
LPPSTTRHWPVRYDAAGLQSQATGHAISSGVPLRRIGTISPSRASSVVWEPVAIQPGATALAVMPSVARSTARERTSPTSAAFAAA